MKTKSLKAVKSVKNPNDVKITFNGNSTEIFHPNSMVCADVQLIIKKAVKSVDAFRIEVKGTETTNFHDFSHLKDIAFDATRDLFEITGFLFGGKKTSKPIDIDVGTYDYRYLFQIPREAPSSFDGANGNIKYTIRTILDSSLAPDFVKEKSFVVFRFEDFNDYVNLRAPIEIEKEKKFGFGPLKKHLHVKMSTEREGYGMGDKINIKVEVNNTSKLNFPVAFLTFNRFERCQGDAPFHKIKKIVKILGRVKFDAIPPKSTRKYSEVMQVPLNSPASNDHLCEIIQISYSVNFTVMPDITPREKRKLKNAGKDVRSIMDAHMTLYVGTVGLHDEQHVKDDSKSENFDLQSSEVDKEIRECKNVNVIDSI